MPTFFALLFKNTDFPHKISRQMHSITSFQFHKIAAKVGFPDSPKISLRIFDASISHSHLKLDPFNTSKWERQCRVRHITQHGRYILLSRDELKLESTLLSIQNACYFILFYILGNKKSSYLKNHKQCISINLFSDNKAHLF